MYELRTYQQEAVDKGLLVLESRSIRKELLVLPTAAGKSIIIAKIVQELEGPVVILQPSKELLVQNYEKFCNVGGEATIYSASVGQKVISKTIFATIGSIKKEVKALKNLGVKHVIIDECHIGVLSESQLRVFLKELDVRNLLGLTATPLVLSSSMGGAELKILTKMKGKLFTQIAYVSQIKDMIANDFWAPLKYKVVKQNQDRLKVNTSGSDFTEESLQEFYEENNLAQQITEYIGKCREVKRKSILVFVPTIQEAESLAQSIPNSEAVSSKTLPKERDRIIREFKQGKINTVFNVGILTTGFDHPELDTIILARSTMSFTLYYQMIGRGVRIHPDKKDTIIIDLSENCNRFGKVENYTVDHVDGYGWGLFRGEYLMSNYPIILPNKPIKYNLLQRRKFDHPTGFTFENGRYKGQELSRIFKKDLNYVVWYLQNVDMTQTERKRSFKNQILKLING